MSSISSNKEAISITSGRKTFVIILKSSEFFCIDHDNITETNSSNKKVKFISDGEDLGIGLLCSDFSPQGNILAFCTLSKTLCVIAINQLEMSVKHLFELARGASKVKFTPSGRYIVVGDKSGDVYLFDLQKKDDIGTLILGHLSLLLDVLVTPDEKYILTCDRDEKIRVSSFPNGYNIITYCLGHREFVSSIHLLPHNDGCLISTSGDATVRFWDYKFGKEIMAFDTNSYLESTNLNANGQTDINIAAITDAVAILVDNVTSLVCVALGNLKTILVIKCTSEFESNKLECCVSQTISLQDSNPWRLTFSSNWLWIVLNSEGKVTVKVMQLKVNSCTFNDDLPNSMEQLLKNLNSQEITSDCKQDIVSLLYKRKFDNIQDYFVKKEARLRPISSLESIHKKTKVQT